MLFFTLAFILSVNSVSAAPSDNISANDSGNYQTLSTQSNITQNSTSNRTIVVASSNATAEEKSNADYICDGDNDQDEIRNALINLNNLTSAWNQFSQDPVMNFGNFASFWYDGTTYHAFYTNNNHSYIGHATSPDGIVWTVKNNATNPIITIGPPNSYDDTGVAVFNAWKENGTWYALYGGNGNCVCYATAPSAEGPWTKYGNNPVIAPGPNADPAGIIKVDSTYYLYTNTITGNRQVDVWTSTNLTSWTKQSVSKPLFIGGRFCSNVV